MDSNWPHKAPQPKPRSAELALSNRAAASLSIGTRISTFAMLVALRKSRPSGVAAGRPDSSSKTPQSPQQGLVSIFQHAAQELGQRAAAAADALGQQLAAVAAPLLEQQRQQQTAQHQLLLASVSGSALEQQQKAFLPDKRRQAGGVRGPPGRNVLGGVADSGGGDSDLLADAEENERFLISEVCCDAYVLGWGIAVPAAAILLCDWAAAVLVLSSTRGSSLVLI